MLKKIFTRLFSRKMLDDKEFNLQSQIDKADALRERGDLHAAMVVYRECLEHDQLNVNLINVLGACLWDIGDEQEALACFELAYSLDDMHIPAVTNYAKVLVDKKRTGEAIALLEHAVVCEPNFSNIYTIYASALFARGEGERAKELYLRGWLGSFDTLRMANGYFFPLSYVEEDQRILAAEHRFWAETIRLIDLDADRLGQTVEGGSRVNPVASLPGPPLKRRIRIGYWSPDLRDHSVRYFFRPMLEGHDHEKFEVFLYHDSFATDAQTISMKESADHFHEVYLLNDIQLYELIRSHQLDIIVEMAGHTSANRIALFASNRFATLQLTGVGYPPTTGLSTIDAKILDRSVVDENASDFYTERPMVLPSSFWCFDPMEDGDVECAERPPVDRSGYITFACVGNISKISDRMLRLWTQIMSRVPGSRLLIRSINFVDVTSREALTSWLDRSGLDMSRVDIKGALGGEAFFRSYDDIDIVLDTFPFNGGTTSCFSTYMGVPVVTLAGDSLVGRMGLSIMANLGAEQWVAYDERDYVEKAVLLARDREFLRQFRREARKSYKTSPLGKGRLFMAEFEAACEKFLELKYSEGELKYQSTVQVLSERELLRRIYCVISAGNIDASRRILNHCLKHYPESGGAHLFVAQNMYSDGLREEALAYLEDRIGRFEDADRLSAFITMAGWSLDKQQKLAARSYVARAELIRSEDLFDSKQLALFKASLVAESESPEFCDIPKCLKAGGVSGGSILVLVPGDEQLFAVMTAQMTALCRIPEGWSVIYKFCAVDQRHAAYKQLQVDGKYSVLIVMQRNIEVLSEFFYEQIVDGLSKYDILGVAGATKWARAHWRGERFNFKSAGFFVESDGLLKLQCLGVSSGEILGDQQVLDGVMLAINWSVLSDVEFDAELAQTGWAMEEDWSHVAAQRGVRLAVHRNLGVKVHALPEADPRSRYSGLLRLQEKYKFPLFLGDSDDYMMLSVPVQDVQHGMDTMRVFSRISSHL